MTDTNAVIFQVLTGSTTTTLYGIVGTRVYFPQPPAGYKYNTASVVFHRSSALRDYYVPDIDVDLVFHCYGGTGNLHSAVAVYNALHARLHGLCDTTVSAGTLVESYQTIGAQDLRDPETGIPFVLSGFRAIVQ